MIAYLWLSLMLGMFFTISGFRKCFVQATRSKVFGLFAKYNVKPAAGWAVVLGEFLGGLGLLSGFLVFFLPLNLTPYVLGLSALSAFLLLPIMGGAIKLSVIPTLKRAWKASGADWSQRASNFLCTAEVMMTMGLVAMVLLYLFGG